MASLRGFLEASTRRRRLWKEPAFRDEGYNRWTYAGLIVPRVFFSSYQHWAHQRPETATRSCGMRKTMVPLIKLVHPDLFAQYPAQVASTNSRSLKDLNTLIDAAEALDGTASANGTTNGLETPLPSVDPYYSLTFFHHKLDRRRDHETRSQPYPSSESYDRTGNSAGESKVARGDGDGVEDRSVGYELRPLVELRAELRFAPALSADPTASLRSQLRRQLEGLLKRVPRGAEEGPAPSSSEPGEENNDEREERMIGEGVRVREGETEEEFYGEGPGGMFRRASRASSDAPRTGGEGPTMTSEELRKLTIEHAADNHHENRLDAGYGSAFFGGGFLAPRGDAATVQARSRLVDDLLRSGRVQFAGVPISREASALRRLHQVLVKNFDHLELHDRGLWSTVMLVLRARSVRYEVQAYSGGPVIIFPEKFTEKNLILFIGETLLSHG